MPPVLIGQLSLEDVYNISRPVGPAEFNARLTQFNHNLTAKVRAAGFTGDLTLTEGPAYRGLQWWLDVPLGVEGPGWLETSRFPITQLPV